MNVLELIAVLQEIPDEHKDKPVMLEVERAIWYNVGAMTDYPKMVILSIFPDPFEEALRKAGVT